MPIMVAVINAKSKTLPCVPGLSLNRRTVGQASCLSCSAGFQPARMVGQASCRSCGAGFQPALTRRVRVLRHRQESPPELRPASPSPGGEYLFSASVVFVAQTASLSVSPEIVAAREDFFNHGWTRINTDEDGFSLISVHPCSSVVGSYWLRLRRAALYRRMPSCRTAPWPGRRNTAKALPICNRRYCRLAICATLNRCGGEGRGECEGLLKLDSGGEGLGASQQLPFWEGLATG